MTDQNNNPTPEAANNMDKAKKAGGILLTIFTFFAKWFILAPLKLISGQAYKLMKELMEYKSILIKRVLSVGALLLVVFNPLFLISDSTAMHYSSMAAYAWEVILAGQSSLPVMLFFGVAVLIAGWILKGMFNAAARSFGTFTSIMVLGIPSLFCAGLYFAFPGLQTLAAVSLFWVAEFILAFYLGAGMASSKIKRKAQGVGDQNIVDDQTDDQDDE
ncbi:MAG: hypothetical protein VX730_02015 [Pseudomonadota bacterium]|nr:hypothetical protein [Pseudomonadota bacterium]